VGQASVDDRVAKLTVIKPHIGRDEAAAAIREVDQIVGQAWQ
jgi:hypothetical protein